MNWITKKRMVDFLGIIVLLLCITEVGLRMYGFCDAVIMREDKAYEYIAVPQERHRFGKHIFYNSQSQRSPELSSTDSVVVDAFGDSFINGGVLTDQDSLATTKFANYLTKQKKIAVAVLNISAGSWGPDNCYAYLQKHGSFGSKNFILFVSSHDAYDDMAFDKVVGVNPQFPKKQYAFAIQELFDRYLIPRLFPSLKKDENEINKKTETSVFNTGFLNFYNYCKTHNTDLTIYLHATKEESINHQYNDQGKQIIDFCEQKKIRLIKELDFNLPISVFRDGIHFNEEGQQQLFENMKDSIFVKKAIK